MSNFSELSSLQIAHIFSKGVQKMKFQFSGVVFIFLLIFIFGFQAIVTNNLTYGQSVYHVENKIGGSGSSNNSNSSSKSNITTTIFIAGGIVIAGLLIYKFFIEKSPGKKDQKSDSSSAQIIPGNKFEKDNSILNAYRKIYEEFPVNFYVGIKNNFADLRKKSFILGVSIKL